VSEPETPRNPTHRHETDRRQEVFVVLPAYNEEPSLPPLLERIEETMAESGLAYRIVVVDDGSRDRSWEIAREASERLPMVLVRHPENQGLGATIRDGLTRACELARAGDVIVSLDADNTHPPELIPRMVARVREGNQVVVASRYQRGSRVCGVPALRRAMSYWGSWLFRVVYPIPGVRDYTCGYRAYRAGDLQQAIAEEGEDFFDQDGFQCMVDILLKLGRRRLIMTEVPLVLRYDMKEGASKMNVGSTVRKTLQLMLARRLGL